MPYNEFLAERVSNVLTEKKTHFETKKMMGGICFMVDDKMCIGVINDDVMARLNPEDYEEHLLKEGCRAMDFTGRPMKGYVFLNGEATDMDDQLEYWVDQCLSFNPLAKSSKKKKK